MKCQYEGCEKKTLVLDVRDLGGKTKRRRECTSGHVTITEEITVLALKTSRPPGTHTKVKK